MSDLETEKFRQIGTDLINEYRQQRGFGPIIWLAIDTPEASAFIRSIQLHEKTKQELAECKQELADFRQVVSDAVEMALKNYPPTFLQEHLHQFIIPKPDPLVEALTEINGEGGFDNFNHYAHNLRAALGALGFEIREKNDG